jgi:hypothetical protein
MGGPPGAAIAGTYRNNNDPAFPLNRPAHLVSNL